MAVDCNAATPAIEATCHRTVGERFSIQVHVSEAPAGGYGGFQTRLRWQAETLRYTPSDSVSAEFLWPDCVFAARADAETAQPLHGCSMFGGEPSSYVGPVLQLQFECLQSGSTEIELVPGIPLNTAFVDVDTSVIEPLGLEPATIVCDGL
jgi:hypothetical protein